MDKNFLIVYVLFVVAFVFATHNVWRRNSRLAIFRKSKEDKIEEIEAENDQRLRLADEWTRTRHVTQTEATPTSSPSSAMDIIIITTPRRGAFRTLTQTATRLAELARRQRFFRTRVILCDVSNAAESEAPSSSSSSLTRDVKSEVNDSELTRLTKRFGFPTIKPPKNIVKTNVFEKEKLDYLYCLNSTSNDDDVTPTDNNGTASSSGGGDFVLLLEDDAYPEVDLFHVLDDVVHSRSRRVSEYRSSLFFKLYHPERLLGYLNPEPTRLLEWILLSAFSASLLRCAIHAAASSTVFRRLRVRILGAVARGAASVRGGDAERKTDNSHSRTSSPVASSLASPTSSSSTNAASSSLTIFLQWMLCFLFAMAALELLDRNSVLGWRRLNPLFYSVVPAPNCCTVAILFPRRQIPGVVSALHGVGCRRGFAKDAALDAIKWRHEVGAFLIEPNLVRHIGFYSTLRKSATVNPFSM